MDILVMIIAATLILGFLVFIHEGGHFIAARAFGVRVTEFMIGLPAPNIGFTFKGTRFGLTCLPLGGYAQVCGMSQPELPDHVLSDILAFVLDRGEVYLEDVESVFGMSEKGAFAALETLSEWGSIVRPRRRDKVNIYRAPADKDAGYELGQSRTVEDFASFYQAEKDQQYFSLPFWRRCTILVAGPAMNLLFVIVAFVLVYSIIGLDVRNTATGESFHYNASVPDAVVMGFNYLGMVCAAIAGLFNPQTAAETVSNSTSIVGIAAMSKTYVEAGLAPTLFFSAVVSASLGLMNLLPIPPLDGGRLLVEIIQKVSRRVVPVRVVNYLSIAGMVLFMGFFVVMVNQDIQRFIFGNWG